MNSFKKEMLKYNNEELTILGRGMFHNNYDNAALNPNFLNEIRRLATILTGDVFPYPENEDAFALTPEQIYYRGKIYKEIIDTGLSIGVGFSHFKKEE